MEEKTEEQEARFDISQAEEPKVEEEIVSSSETKGEKKEKAASTERLTENVAEESEEKVAAENEITEPAKKEIVEAQPTKI